MDSDIEAKVKKYSHTMPPLGVTRESVGMALRLILMDPS